MGFGCDFSGTHLSGSDFSLADFGDGRITGGPFDCVFTAGQFQLSGLF